MSDAPDAPGTLLGAPLAGRSVVVTRTRAQAASLVEPLEALGAECLTMPVLETVDPDDWAPADAAIADLAGYDWVVFTSTNGIERFLRRFRRVGGSREALLGRKFAAVGSATAEKMRRHGLPPQLVPDDSRAEGLVEAFRALGAGPGLRVLVPRALRAREVFPDALRALGAEVDVVPVYDTRPVPADPAVLQRFADGTVDCVSFTSGAIARAFAGSLADTGVDPDTVLVGVAVASIGPVTTAALEALGYRADIEAPEATMESLATAIAAFTAWKR